MVNIEKMFSSKKIVFVEFLNLAFMIHNIWIVETHLLLLKNLFMMGIYKNCLHIETEILTITIATINLLECTVETQPRLVLRVLF